MNETWLAIPGFEGRYEVSDFGNVRSLPRITNGRYGLRRANGVSLRPGPRSSGHLSVSIGRKSMSVHALVMLAFKGKCPSNMEVLHMDHNPANNVLANLKYGTRSENLKMDYVVGVRTTHPNFINSLNGKRK